MYTELVHKSIGIVLFSCFVFWSSYNLNSHKFHLCEVVHKYVYKCFSKHILWRLLKVLNTLLPREQNTLPGRGTEAICQLLFKYIQISKDKVISHVPLTKELRITKIETRWPSIPISTVIDVYTPNTRVTDGPRPPSITHPVSL